MSTTRSRDAAHRPSSTERTLAQDLAGMLATRLRNAAGYDDPDDHPFVEWRTDPTGFMVEKLGVPRHTLVWSENPGYADHTWDATPDPFHRAALAIAEGNDVAIESATGTGKTFWAACMGYWFLACWPGATVTSIAPTEKQLQLHMWKEAGRLWHRFKAMFPGAEMTKLRVRMRPPFDEWMMHGFGVGVGAVEESAVRAQGHHDEHMLFILEEGPGIHPAVMKAVENTCVGEHNLRLGLGNPDSVTDPLHQLAESPGVVAIRVSAYDHPNVVTGNPRVIPGAVTQRSIDKRLARYGPDHWFFRSRTQGICPGESVDSLIKWAWCKEAGARHGDLELRTGSPPALGVDVAASTEGDWAAIAQGVGACLLEVRSFPCDDPNVLGAEVSKVMAASSVRAQYVGIDAIGVGAGTVGELKRVGKYVQALKGSEEPKAKVLQEEVFRNLRSQMWWQMREDLMNGRIALPDDPELWVDLTTPRWAPNKTTGKIEVESKDSIKKRLGRSPDKGDAAVYWNWVRGAGATFGWDGTGSNPRDISTWAGGG